MNYYRRYLGDYMKDTMHLSIMEHGTYGLLLDAYYATEKPLPADYDALYRVCRAMTKGEKEAVRRVVDAYFPIHADGLRHNSRADSEIATAQATIEKQRESAVKSTAKRTVNQDSTVQSTERSSRQPITTNHQPLTITPQPPTVAADEPPPDEGGAKLANRATWTAYAFAYKARYGADPVPNAKQNALIAQFVQRIGASEAPAVAAFYVRSNNAFYVRIKHSLEALVKNAEGLRTEWVTGRTVTETEARQLDRKQSNLSVAEKLIAEERAKHV